MIETQKQHNQDITLTEESLRKIIEEAYDRAFRAGYNQACDVVAKVVNEHWNVAGGNIFNILRLIQACRMAEEK